MIGARLVRVGSFVVLAVLLLPAVSFAQSAIAGSVTDTTGALLPGVTVEARSPALIEQVRTAVSDAQRPVPDRGTRPGTYNVTFALPGFSTFVRDGIVLESEFTATDQRAAAGRRPRGDRHGLRRVAGRRRAKHESRTVLSQEQMEVLPSGRSYQSLAATIPALGSALAGTVRRRRVDADVAGNRRGVRVAVRRHGARSRRHERREHPQHRTNLRHLSQSERLRGNVVPGGRGLRRVADRRRPDQHDPEAGRQPIHRGTPSSPTPTSICRARTTTPS